MKLDREFDQQLKNTNSKEFKSLQQIMKKELEKTLCTGKFATGCSAKILGFRPGSVKADFLVTIPGEQSDVKQHMKSALKNLPSTIDNSKVEEIGITRTGL